MMPPTGLTLIVHTLIILLKKSAKVLHLSLPHTSKQKDLTVSHMGVSVAIIILITFYIFGTVGLFMHKAIFDSRATWKMAHETFDKIGESIFSFDLIMTSLQKRKSSFDFSELHYSEAPPYETTIEGIMKEPTTRIANYHAMTDDELLLQYMVKTDPPPNQRYTLTYNSKH